MTDARSHHRKRRSLLLAVAAAALGLLALPAASPAFTTIGSNLASGAGTNTNVGACGSPPGCTFTQFALPPANQAPGGLTAPSDGVIVRWRVQSDSGAAAVALRVLRPSGASSYSGQGRSATATTAGAGGIETFATRLRVRTGDRVGLDNASEALLFAANPAATLLYWNPALAEGDSREPLSTNLELLLNADIEPDADNDGFGDESQDQCPSDAARQGPCAAADTSPPVISDLSTRRRSFRAGRKRGSFIEYVLSENASVKFRVQRRRSNGKYRYVRGSLTRSGTNGDNEHRFRGRIGGRYLSPGRYRLVATATDPAGNKSAPRRARFRIVR